MSLGDEMFGERIVAHADSAVVAAGSGGEEEQSHTVCGGENPSGRGALDPDAGISEQAEPRGVIAPAFRCPAVLYGTENPFWMWHHDGDAAIARGESGHAEGRAVGVEGVAFRGDVVVIDEASGDESGLAECGGGFLGFEFRVTFSVCDGYGEDCAGHFVEEDARAGFDLER